MRSVYRVQSHPAASLNCRLAQSSIDALTDIKVRGGLCCQVPVWPDLDTFTDLRIRSHPRAMACVPGYVNANAWFEGSKSQSATAGKALESQPPSPDASH